MVEMKDEEYIPIKSIEQMLFFLGTSSNFVFSTFRDS